MIVAIGRTVSGKSSVLNALMGGRFLPEGLELTTNMFIFARHVDDRPEYLHEDVCFFKRFLGDIKNVMEVFPTELPDIRMYWIFTTPRE